MRKVTKVQRHDPYSNMWDVYMSSGSVQFETYAPEIDVHSKYVGGGRSVATVKVPLDGEGNPSLTIRQMDGIARRVDGRFKLVSFHTVRDVRGDHYIRSYAITPEA
jgi:hypothetical protein